ncbi:GNAT family N-acetyltransferase [Streptomyces sp. SID4934]|uniref:GNAT family N-acetyltransferase n=1 Tax=unclassified Streptomyces TaxID=2593676 RepID=UPI00081E4822|nr:GNAT family N-acetyltransferase [Streptomyces sp. ScaeMP-6W]MYQ72259.1 GNAT family N-acetyltransferase [Streptomyces sp. SID4934]SCD97672.1 L-amino acid N-acyltransferase YncA [Streptomyces sp. ScaeMP-6W]
MRPLIRPARHGDGAALARIDFATWSPLHAVTEQPKAPADPFFDGHRDPREHLVAEEDGELLGYAVVRRPVPLPAFAHVRQIQGLAVREEARGRGVARALLRACVAEARAQDARRLTLRVLGHNAPARALYASEGFRVEGVLPGEVFVAGTYVDDVLMGRAL